MIKRAGPKLNFYTCWFKGDEDRVMYHCDAETPQHAAELYRDALGQSGVVSVRDASGIITEHEVFAS